MTFVLRRRRGSLRQIEYSTTRLVSRHHGTPPVLLTCPHDGGEVPAGVLKRTWPTPECPDFETDCDRCTRTVTTGLAQRLLDLAGEAPAVVIAEFDRDYIDANRSAACAFEPGQGADAQQFYDEYHNRSASSSMTSGPRTAGSVPLRHSWDRGHRGDPGRALPGHGAGIDRETAGAGGRTGAAASP
jgi:N-formylglutamate amidohydrolase